MSTTAVKRAYVPTRRNNRKVAAVAAAVVLLTLTFWWVAPWSTARPITVTGTAYTNAEQTAIAFTADSWMDSLRFGLTDGIGFAVENASWTSTDDDYKHARGGPVECLAPGDSTRVELSYVEIVYRPWDDGGPGTAVTFIRCLE